MRDAGQRRLQSRAGDEGPIEIHPIVGSALARARPKCRGIEDGNENDSSQHVRQGDLANQVLEHDRPFVLVAVIRAESDQSFVRLRLRADPHRERNQVIAPDAVVLQGDPIVAATRRVEIELIRTGNKTSDHVWTLSLRVETNSTPRSHPTNGVGREAVALSKPSRLWSKRRRS